MQRKVEANEIYIERVYNAPIEAVWEAVDGSGQGRKMVGTSRFYIDHAFQRSTSGRSLALYDARS